MRYYGKIHSKLPIFRIKSVKIYNGQFFFYTDTVCGVCDKYPVWPDLIPDTIVRFHVEQGRWVGALQVAAQVCLSQDNRLTRKVMLNSSDLGVICIWSSSARALVNRSNPDKHQGHFQDHEVIRQEICITDLQIWF